jgi:hypothetical protein
MTGGRPERSAVESDEILVARDGPVLTLTFNRPAAQGKDVLPRQPLRAAPGDDEA